MQNTLRMQDSPTADTPTTFYDAAGASDTGQKRTSNEDTFLVASLQRSMRVTDGTAPTKLPGWSSEVDYGTLLMVADGMGGHGGGDVASQAAVDAIASYLVNVMPSASSMLETLPEDARASLHGLRGNLSEAIMAGDEAIRAKTNMAAPSMGTTLTMAFIAPPSLYVAHVGDSRCYVFRDGRLKLLTNDHTLANKIAQISGKRPEESTRLNHVLWNCLGGGDEARPNPEVLRLDLLPTDSVLLCTDGLTNELDESAIIAELTQPGSSKEACERLVRAANQRGGQDNITAVLARPTQHRAQP